MTYTPTISKAQFDEQGDEIRNVLISVINDTIKCKQELSEFLDSKEPDEGGAKPMGGLMVGVGSLIDSLVVVSASVAISDITGAKIHPDDIRSGGWETPEAVADDVMSKMRNRCPDEVPPVVEALNAGHDDMVKGG